MDVIPLVDEGLGHSGGRALPVELEPGAGA
jgi:hypothetical protein